MEGSLEVLRQDMIVRDSPATRRSLTNSIGQTSAPDMENCLLAVIRYLRGCMVLSFTYAHFDEVLSRCITQEANNGVGGGGDSLDPEWEKEIVNFAELLDCMAAACPGDEDVIVL